MIEDRETTDLDNNEAEEDDEAIPLHFDERTLLRVVEFLRYELDHEKLPEIPRPVPTERLADCVP